MEHTGPGSGPDSPDRVPEDAYGRIEAGLTAPGAPFEVVRAENGSLMYAGGPRTLREFVEVTWAYGDQPFLVDAVTETGADTVTYGAFFAAASALAVRFVDTYGLTSGDRALIAMGNHPECHVAFWATQLAGLIAVPINPSCPEGELSRVLGNCEPRVLLVDGEWLPRIARWGEREQPRVVVFRHHEQPLPQGELRVELYGDLPAPDPYAAPPEVDVRPEDDCVIRYPQGTVTTQLAQAGAAMDARFRTAAAALAGGRFPGLGPTPVTYLRLPFSDPVALSEVYGAMAAGGTLVLNAPPPEHDPEHAPADAPAPASSRPTPAPPTSETRLTAPDRRHPVPDGQTGDLWLRGQALPHAYWRDERATAEAFTPDGWFRTGECAVVRDGRVSIVTDTAVTDTAVTDTAVTDTAVTDTAVTEQRGTNHVPPLPSPPGNSGSGGDPAG